MPDSFKIAQRGLGASTHVLTRFLQIEPIEQTDGVTQALLRMDKQVFLGAIRPSHSCMGKSRTGISQPDGATHNGPNPV